MGAVTVNAVCAADRSTLWARREPERRPSTQCRKNPLHRKASLCYLPPRLKSKRGR
ncbi:hypothetical protein GEOBRER4_n1506 [Citrifermentans bremense]|uniref:Uncharacterized protein n=1 Tax=Citrifermentans bremense TaxID=60035 RepID=A0A7R7IYQ7_9BACT|nr:hypothetical protein GEOBRER4_n1506 [Citrifermentans bremense]